MSKCRKFTACWDSSEGGRPELELIGGLKCPKGVQQALHGHNGLLQRMALSQVHPWRSMSWRPRTGQEIRHLKRAVDTDTRNIQSNQKKLRLRGHHIRIRPTRTERMSGAHPSSRLPGSRAFLGKRWSSKKACSSMGLTAYFTCWHLHPADEDHYKHL